MKIGVVIPAYNVREYIGEALNSLLAQTNPNWCVCVVDDGSTDDTRQVVESYVQKDDRIHLISQKIKGFR